MPTARALPKKYMSSLVETQESLRLLGQRTHRFLAEVEAHKQTPQRLQTFLQEIEATVYRLAYVLSEMKVAENCDECPLAPSTSVAKVHLLLLANDLEEKASLARMHANM